MKTTPSACARLSRHFLTGLAGLVLPASCDPGYVPPPVPQAGAGGAPSQLATGYAIHQAKCANCHAFADPAAFAPQDLSTRVMPTMARKAQLTAAEQQAVLAYLLAVRKP